MAEYRTLTRDYESEGKARELSRSLFFHCDAKYYDVLCAVKATTPNGWPFEVIYMDRNRLQVVGHIAWKHMIMSRYGGKIEIKGQKVDVVEMMDGLDQTPRLDGQFWVRLVNVPYCWRTMEGAEQIFNGIGTILEFDESFGQDNRFVRVKVHVESRSKIPNRADYEVAPLMSDYADPERCTIRFVVEEPSDQEIRAMPLLRLDGFEKAAFAEAPWLELLNEASSVYNRNLSWDNPPPLPAGAVPPPPRRSPRLGNRHGNQA